ncbi:4-hydroxy-3-methylbut-2-enyl diphosphate reductase [Methyloceanibacter methanicus]|uniref:4-hydroxy-3-methylbut-2-enyl diphosphate reductase n=1 Tax=Methyloceanibacter methanicus TaxID=1774968 RepID=A0A1E3W4M1_9HYPH|nr:4-hydroxy-3-methylbut-2-enyl diphosphate reductase [Methyloceanibacter methanicus]ODS00753.1 4-hydroxy-3-methylbut-2-enyl diphosphate reductase [Methyloceanibacter methanicus]
MTGTPPTPQRSERPPLTVYLASPRGFCAGVDRAIQIVELALEKYGAPVYVRHAIVHNRYVVESLEAKGAIFVEELDEIPETDAPIVFSAHGVPKAVPADARNRRMFMLDATCPLVSKVHIEAERLFDHGHEILLIGHAGHPEVVGTTGQLPPGASRSRRARTRPLLRPRTPRSSAVITQTTLSVDDTRDILAVLQTRFPDIVVPRKDDICYATTNRQDAVKRIAAQCDAMIVVGSPNSSNSLRLVEVAQRAGCPQAVLVERRSEIDWSQFENIRSLGVTAGASAPEVLVDSIIDAFAERFDVAVQTVTTAEETISFKLPRPLRDTTAA